MAKKKEPSVLETLDKIDNLIAEGESTFSGVARSVECFDNQGFRNFRILTLTIENGKVTNITRSDPYANFEAIVKLELANELAILHLNNNWENGKTLSK